MYFTWSSRYISLSLRS